MEKERKPFVETTHCLSGNHCGTCRLKNSQGEKFRQSLMHLYRLPNDDVNFDCPYGKQWIETASVDTKTSATEVDGAKAKETCTPCSRRKRR